MKKTALIIMIITALGTMAYGDDHPFYKTLDWEPARPLICYPTVLDPLIEADSECIFVVYNGSNVTQGEHIFEMHSHDNGETWSDPFDVFEGDAGGHSIAADGNNLHVIALYGTGLLYRRTTDAGYSWSEIKMLVTDARYWRMSICAHNNKVFCTYNNDIYITKLLRSFDNGQTWDEPLIIGNAHLIQPPYMVYSNSIWHRTYCTFQNEPPAAWEIFYTRSTDDGETWSEPQMISDYDGIGSQRPNCGADDNGTIAITWYDYKYGAHSSARGEIICRVSTDYGLNWGPEIRITGDTLSRYSDVYIDSNNVYVIYDSMIRNEDNSEIFLRKSPNAGVDWEEIEQVSEIMGRSLTPGISLSKPNPDTDVIHTIWYEQFHDSNWCVFYRRKTEQVTDINDENRSNFAVDIEVLQNYPNPFNVETTIEYSLSNEADIDISIYNVLGRKIQTLFLGRRQAGTHSIKWDAVDYSSGIYFCKLTTGEKTFTKRMVLLK
jgi:hypothetical protein